MNFNLPTTKEEMYDALNEIFYFYRIRREGWENMELKSLELEPMAFSEKTVEQLSILAEQQVAVQKQKDVLLLKTSLSTDVALKTASKLKKQAQLNESVAKVVDSFDKAKSDYSEWANKRGMGTSDMLIKQLNEYELQKSAQIDTVTASYNAEIDGLQAEIDLLQERLAQADGYYDEVYRLAQVVKLEELKLEQDKTIRDVFKYNNSLSEKIQRYENTLVESKANLEVKYMQIDANMVSKDELIQRGYYNDVIKCVCAYYDTLDPIPAYQDIVDEAKLSIYLDEFYQNIVYGYQCKAQDALR